MKVFTGSALWSLLRQSDAMSCCVLGSMLLFSIVSWAVAIHKFMATRKHLAEIKSVGKRLQATHSFDQLRIVAESCLETMPGQLLQQAVRRAKGFLEAKVPGTKGLSPVDRELLRNELDQAVGDAIMQEEQHMVILKTAAEVGPLLGLFGTVWGLIHAFVRISQEQSADIVTVAPGIAEALVTTMMGIAVAIPALIFYHALSSRIALLEQQLVGLGERCEEIVDGALNARDER